MAVEIETRIRAATAAIVPEMHFMGSLPYVVSLEQGMLELFGPCVRLLFGLELPEVELVARGMCIGRIGQQFKIVLHMLDPKPGRPYCPSEAFTFHTSILSLAACASDASGTSSR